MFSFCLALVIPIITFATAYALDTKSQIETIGGPAITHF